MGRGSTFAKEDCCEDCEGSGVIDENIEREIVVERGVPHMHKIPFPGEGTLGKSGERGDLVVILIQTMHPVFQRSHNDLIINPVKIELSQALCGFSECFTHLDGRKLCLSSEAGEVIKPNAIKVVHGEGMPLHNNPFERGDLLLKFRVVFPKNGFASPEQLKTLETLLPPREDVLLPPDVEEVQMVDFVADVTAEGLDNDEDGRGPQFQRVQCQTS